MNKPVCPSSFRAVIDLWPTYGVMASDVGFGCTAAKVQKWSERDNIPSHWWEAVLATSRARAAGFRSADFTRLAARDLEPARARA